MAVVFTDRNILEFTFQIEGKRCSRMALNGCVGCKSRLWVSETPLHFAL